MSFFTDTLPAKAKELISGDRPPVVPVVPLRGVIGNIGSMRRGLTVDAVADNLERAFKQKRLAAVALVINSPGGSPVQSALIAKRIRQWADEKGTKVIAFCEDVAASGGYWLAAAADEIIVDDNSIVGSIGVISASLGFQDAIKKLGIERRLHTSGDNKSFLDPFLPEQKKDVARLKAVQAEMHESFIAYVKERRGDRLGDDPEIFSGAFWTGKRAVDLGLADGTGDVRSVLRARFGDKVKMPTIADRKSWLSRRFGADAALPGANWADDLLASVEERLTWDRFRP